MRHFSKKEPRKDVSFIKKSTLKKLELNYEKQNLGRPLDQLLREMPPLGVCWVLEVPFTGGHEAYYVKTNRPQINSRINREFGLGRFGYEQPMIGRADWSELYVEFDNWFEGRRLTDWFRQCGTTGRDYNPSKKNMTLTLRDRTGVLEQWHLVGCFPTEIRYHQDMVSFNQPDEITCGVSFNIDHARLNL